jgi:GNAT superfamily N-acetyltransferase
MDINMSDINLRPILPIDEPFLWEMLFLALYVPEGRPACSREILNDPDIACYVQGWGRPGDWGLLARDGDKAIGAIWLRLWSGDEKGYGFISPTIPELSIALQPEYRDKGLGTRMIRTVISMAQEQYIGLSLSVVEMSPARQLYERLGFRKVGQVLDSLVMLCCYWGNMPNGPLP